MIRVYFNDGWELRPRVSPVRPELVATLRLTKLCGVTGEWDGCGLSPRFYRAPHVPFKARLDPS